MVNRADVSIRKADGTEEPFYSDKLFSSLVNSGADEELARDITDTVAHTLRGGEKTADIYRRAFRMLKSNARPLAARYSVKRALAELGPTGYPFEDYMAEIFKAKGWACETRQIREGACVSHELDLVGTRESRTFAAEVKFHNNHGLKSDIKVALYVRARYDDLAARALAIGKQPFTDTWLMTNTKFTSQAIEYAECAGLRLLSWDYPKQGNLRELIEETRLHPISCLTTLSVLHKRQLMQQGIVLCKQLSQNTNLLQSLGLSDRAIASVLGETTRVSGSD